MSNVRSLNQYFTPLWAATALVEYFFPNLNQNDFVVEPSCGSGAFLSALPEDVPAIGVDIDAKVVSEARKNTGREILHGDFRTIPLDVTPTLILGNPPFRMDVIDGFLDRAFIILPDGGQVGFILPTYAFQTAGRVAEYAERWSLAQDMIPRNLFPGLSLPLVFARFAKDQRKTMVGFALYRELADVQRLPDVYRVALAASSGSVWRRVVEIALGRLGGESDLAGLYKEIEGRQPSRTQFWREQVRRTLRRYAEFFVPVSTGRYALAQA